MGEVQTIEEANGLVRIWDYTGQTHTFTFPKLKDMTVQELIDFLHSQPAWSSYTDMLCFEEEFSKDKAELKPLDTKKKLVSLKKKWGANKADHYYRIIYMRAGDNYIPHGMELSKNKDGRKSFKRNTAKNKSLSVSGGNPIPTSMSAPIPSINSSLPPALGTGPASPSGAAPPSFGAPPPPPFGTAPISFVPPPPPLETAPPSFGAPPPPLGTAPPSFGAVPPPLSAPPSLEVPPPSFGGVPSPSSVPPAFGAPPPLNTGLPPSLGSVPSPTGAPPSFASPPPPPPPMSVPAPPPAPVPSTSTIASPPPSVKEKKGGWFSRRKTDKVDKKGKEKGRDAPPPSADDLAAEKILREINAFDDPTGEYDYAAEESRPDFLISNQDLQNRYLNLNTSNANKIARSEHFQKILISWVNKHLSQRKMSISNLHADLQNGVALINLLEVVSRQEIKKYYKEPKHIPHQLENLEIVLKFLAVLGIPIKAECQDIYHGRLGIICGMLFMVIQKFKDGEESGDKKKKKIDIKVQKLDAKKAAARLADTGPVPSSSNAPVPTSVTSPVPGPNRSKEFGGFDSKPSAAELKSRYATSMTPMANVPFVNTTATSPALPSSPPLSRPPNFPSTLPPPPTALTGPIPSLPPPTSFTSPMPSLPPPPVSMTGPIPSLPPSLPPTLPPPSPAGGRPMPVSRPPPPAPMVPPPLSLAEIEASVEGDLSLDALDDLDLTGDILDLENFTIGESGIDIDNNDIMKDLESMKSFLENMAGEEELTLDDLNISFDDILL